MKKLLLTILTITILLTFVSCKKDESVMGFYFDTAITISANVKDKAVLDEALLLCTHYENILSKTRENSDVWKINNSQGEKVVVSRETIEVLELATRVSELSGGAFDVTVAPIMELWDFTQEEDISLPNENDIHKALSFVDYKKIVIENDSVQIPKGMEIDLGGIAKGYIADKIAEFLENEGVSSGILNFGGNIICIGEKTNGKPFSIGIRKPYSTDGKSLAVVEIVGKSVVTSGIDQRGFLYEGTRYHHLINPKTGYPEQNGLASVTIITESSAKADALSTAVFLLGEEKGMELIKSLDDVEAIFIRNDNSVISSFDGAVLL